MTKTITSVFLLALYTVSLYAQKLPGKQEISLWAPAKVAIDGKLAEWGDKLQAYNKSTLIYYSIANDDDNLYLAIQIDKKDIISKAISGAITFTVNNRGTKSDVKFPAVSFPLLNPNSGTKIRSNLKDQPSANNSLLLETNKELRNSANEIKFSDIKEITDTIKGTHTERFNDFRWYPLFGLPGYYLPTVNKTGIRAAAAFEGSWKYNYELAIPLKYLKITPDKKFTYNIRLNGPMYKTAKPTAGYAVRFKIDQENHTAIRQDNDLLEATDFWGEYMLAKKP